MAEELDTEQFQGRVLEIDNIPSGDELAVDHASGATTIQLNDASDFSDEGGQVSINGVVYDYLTMDEDLDTITLATGLATSLTADPQMRVLAYPISNEKWAMVDLDETEDVIFARVPHQLQSLLEDVVRDLDQQESVMVQLQESDWVITDVIGQDPSIDGGYIDTTNMVIPPPTVIGPTSSPVPTVEGSISALFVSWAAASVPTGMSVQVHINTVSFVPILNDAATLAKDVNGTMTSITAMPDGSPLVQGTTYYISLIAYNTGGTASPSAAVTGVLRQVTGPDVDVNAVWAGFMHVDRLQGGILETDEIEVRGAGLFAHGAAGERVGISGDGFAVIGPTSMGNPKLIDFPTDGGVNVISSAVQASTLTVIGDPNNGNLAASFRNLSFMEPGSSLTLQNITAPPLTAPVAESYFDNYYLQHNDLGAAHTEMWGWTFDGNNWYALTLDIHNVFRLGKGSWNGAVSSTDVVVSNPTGGNLTRGLAIMGGYLWELYKSATGYRIRKRDLTTLAVVAGSDVALANSPVMNGASNAWMSTDGTNLYIAYNDWTTSFFTVDKYSTAGTRLAHNVSSSTTTVQGFCFAPSGTDGWSGDRYILNGGATLRPFTLSGSTLTEDTNNQWTAAEGGTVSRGLVLTQLLGTGTTDFWSGLAVDDLPVQAPCFQAYFKRYTHIIWNGIADQTWTAKSTFSDDLTTRSLSITTTSASVNITGPAGSFSSSDVGATLSGNANIPAGRTIATVTSDTTATMSGTASASGTAATTLTEHYQTAPSPAGSFAMHKRSSWKITVGSSPTGHSKIYLAQPSGTLYLQQTLDDPVISYQNRVQATTTAIPASGNFPGVTPALIKSQALGSDGQPAISLGGDGAASMAALLLRSPTDVTALAGNKPPLRIGDVAGVHMRVDGNEIQTMSDDSHTGQLNLNIGAPDGTQATAGAIKIGAYSFPFKAIRFGSKLLTAAGGSGHDTVNHGGNGAPDYVIVGKKQQGTNGWVQAGSYTSTNFDVQMFGPGGGVFTNGTQTTVDWIAIWV